MKYSSTLLTIPRPISPKRKRMPPENRAAQFAPFAALSGYEEEIREVCRSTDARPYTAEDMQAELEFKLNRLYENVGFSPYVKIRYFLPDDTKRGGAFFTVGGKLISIDPQSSILQLEGAAPISIESICEIESPLFDFEEQ